MPLSALTAVFSGANQSGTSTLYGVGRSQRYQRIPRSELSAAGLVAAISSVTAYSSSSADTTLLLFGQPYSWLALEDYFGRYVQITNVQGSSEALDKNLSDVFFDDVATSALVVATSREREFRLSFRDLFLSRWRTAIDATLANGARRHGDPVLWWEMFPNAVNLLDPNRMYLRIDQKLDIVIDGWADYEAGMTYHVFLYLDGSGRLRGYVPRWAYWIEDGLKADDIEVKLKPAVESGADTLNAELGAQLDAVSAFRFSDLYYLPGRQLRAAPTGTRVGWTTDDTTIVLEA